MVKITASYIDVHKTSENHVYRMNEIIEDLLNEKQRKLTLGLQVTTEKDILMCRDEHNTNENVAMSSHINTDLTKNSRKSALTSLSASNIIDSHRSTSKDFKLTSHDDSTVIPPQKHDECIAEEKPFIYNSHIKRKQIDITKSSAYREIYAHNLRLYSAILAKQMAKTNQVGREMDNIRRNRIKQKALNRPSSTFKRSQSFNVGDYRPKVETPSQCCSESDNPLMRRSNSEGAHSLRHCIKKVVNNINSLKNENEILHEIEDEDEDDPFQPESNDRISPEPENETVSSKVANLTRDQARDRAACLRAEHIRRRLRSFDNTVEKMNAFLSKAKNVKKADKAI